MKTIIEIILEELEKIGRNGTKIYDKNDLILAIYFRARREGYKLKIESIARYLRHLRRKGVLTKVQGNRYYIILYNIRKELLKRKGINNEGNSKASALRSRLNNRILIHNK